MEQTTHINLREERIDIPQDDHVKKYSRNILTDLEKYNFSYDIKLRANYIYKIMNVCHRATKRVLLLFFCVYSAYKELKIDVIPTELGKKFNLTHGKLQKSISTFSPLQTGYRSVTKPLSILIIVIKLVWMIIILTICYYLLKIY